jgi:adenosylmethionine-8-amino-7-oxononanoate aminotransferase
VRDRADGRRRVFLCCSGSEAIDTSMKLARIAHVQAGQPQRKLIISRTRGYHGVAYGGTSAQGIAPNKENFGPFVDSVVQVPADDVEALATVMHQHSDEIAAVLTEPVQGAAGIHPPQDGYLASLRRLCDQHGAYLIFDEVITGFGRLGSWFASHHYDVRPDLVTFAKGVTSGYQPLGGVFVGPAPRSALEATATSSSATGSRTPATRPRAPRRSQPRDPPREDLVARATHVGDRLRDGLRALAPTASSTTPRRGSDVGGRAAPGPERRGDARRDARGRRHHAAINADTLTFCPPLVITDAQIDRIVDAVAAAAATALYNDMIARPSAE